MPASLLVIGTYDDQDRANFGLFDRGGIATSAPQTHIVVAMRKTSYTHKNLLERKAATINIPSVAQLAEAARRAAASTLRGRSTGPAPARRSQGSAMARMSRRWPAVRVIRPMVVSESAPRLTSTVGS